MNDKSPTGPGPVPPTEAAAASPPQATARIERFEWLFRDALRRRQVHPLMELLRRYRGQEGA